MLLLGNPVTQSLSPVMQNSAFSELGIDCRYQSRETDQVQLPELIAALRLDRAILGANVTIPLKESVIPLLDQLHPLAARIGAVNTISRRDGRLVGWNTDVIGFQRALRECGYDVAGKPVAIVGAGGAARAVAESLREVASCLFLIARHLDRAQRLISDLALDQAEAFPMDQLDATLGRAALVVNATPVDLLSPGIVRGRIFDLRSRRSREGRAMLLHQGAASFEIWTGRPAPLGAMRSALERAAEAVTA